MKILCRNHEKLIYKDRLEVYFKGVFIYKYGNVGLMSVELFLEDFLNSIVDFKTIFGCFWIIITDKSDGSICFFCDNSGIMPLYIDDSDGIGGGVSDSLISLVSEMRYTREDMDWNSVISFLEFGFVFSGKTFFRNIHRCPGNVVGVVSGGMIRYEEKKLGTAPCKRFCDREFESELKRLLHAFKTTSVVMDCSGGVDSRLLVTLANAEKIPYTLFVRGWKGCADIIIAEKIASLLHTNLAVLPAEPVENFHSEMLEAVWKEIDGVYPLFEAKQLLDSYTKKNTLERKYNIGGIGGGEYFRTYFCLRNKANTRGIVFSVNGMRSLVSNIIQTDLYERYIPFIQPFLWQKAPVSRMEKHHALYSSQIFPYKSGLLFGCAANYTPLYGPFLEYRFVTGIRNASASEKWFDRIFRKIISRNNSSLAKMKTIYGMSLSDNILYVVKDVFIFSFTFIKRVFSKLIKRKMYKPKKYVVSAENNFEGFKNSEIYHDMKNVLSKSGLLKENVDFESLSVNILERLLVIYFWFVFLEKQGISTGTPAINYFYENQ